MPYDNDLSHYGQLIVNSLTPGTRNSNTAVVIQSDYLRHTNMRRRRIVDGVVRNIEILSEDSSDVSNFSAYLDWASQTFEAQHWAIVVLGHGGKLNEISPDDHGGSRHSRTWMPVEQFASAINTFNENIGGKLDFLFLNNCNKATLEVVYEARNCAQYTLASQLEIAIPNYYHDGFLEILNDDSVTGLEVAKAIMNSESSEAYHTLTLVNNHNLEILPRKLSTVIQAVLNERSSTPNIMDLPTYQYSDEKYCDILLLLEHLSNVSGCGSDEVSGFSDFLNSSVIAYHKTGGEFYGVPFDFTNANNICGLGLYVPENQQSIYRYSSLSLYQEVDLPALYRSIILPSS